MQKHTRICARVHCINQPHSSLSCSFNNRGELFFLNWLAPTETSSIGLLDAMHSCFGISKMVLFMGQFFSNPPTNAKVRIRRTNDQCVAILLIYQHFSISPVQVELIPRTTRFIFLRPENGLGLEFLALVQLDFT